MTEQICDFLNVSVVHIGVRRQPEFEDCFLTSYEYFKCGCNCMHTDSFDMFCCINLLRFVVQFQFFYAKFLPKFQSPRLSCIAL